MGAFEGFSKKIGTIAGSASKKSGDLVETARLNSEIGRLQTEIEDLQFELGGAYYQAHQNDTSCEFSETVKTIAAKEKEIQIRNEKLLHKKGMLYCPSCGTVVAMEDDYCSKCGAGIKGVVKLPEETARICPNCAATIKDDAQFCGQCGLKVL
ncbi:MAG: zinc ribbon domain-containing protein [Eubacteriales bacterium]|nr:zinc ribbon domain-containing protein [Eubacteriales bacterium]